MQKLQFKPFDRNHLIEELKKAFPNHKIQTGFGGFQVRTSGFTVTGNVNLQTNAQKGTIATRTNLDMAVVFLFMLPPVGIYVLLKKEKQKAMEKEVVAKLNEILEPV